MSERKMRIFSEMIDSFLMEFSPSPGGGFDIYTAKAVIKQEGRIYAISGDLDKNSICDELNFYSTKEVFEDCREKTKAHQENLSAQWVFEYANYIANICIPSYDIPSDIKMHDLYITKDMEGFDEVVNKLITMSKVVVL